MSGFSELIQLLSSFNFSVVNVSAFVYQVTNLLKYFTEMLFSCESLCNKRISKVRPLAPLAEIWDERYNKYRANIENWITYCRFSCDILICSAFSLCWNYVVV